MNRLGGSNTTASGGRPAKLGAKKATASINFEEAERKARAEDERRQQLVASTQREVAQPPAQSNTVPKGGSSSTTKPAEAATTPPTNAPTIPSSTSDSKKGGAAPDVARLGIGFNRLGMASSNPPPASSRRTTSNVDAPTTARDKFGNQKAISSEMFFERGAYDPAAVSEAKTKLAQFQGATSISSNQYFGREDEDHEGMGSPGSFTGNESLSALESATRDALSRVMAKEEVQNAMESVRAGALKVSHYFSPY